MIALRNYQNVRVGRCVSRINEVGYGRAVKSGGDHCAKKRHSAQPSRRPRSSQRRSHEHARRFRGCRHTRCFAPPLYCTQVFLALYAIASDLSPNLHCYPLQSIDTRHEVESEFVSESLLPFSSHKRTFVSKVTNVNVLENSKLKQGPRFH